MLILLLILYDPTTLVYPPYSHTLGYHRGTLSQLILATGRPLDAFEIGGLSAVKFKSLDDPGTTADDDELTLIITDLLSNSLYYNVGFSRLGTFKSPVLGDSALWNPSDCEAVSSGTLWVSDTRKDRIVRFYLDGNDLKYHDSFGKFGLLPGFFDSPRGISVTPSKIYVCDSGNNRIQIFSRGGKFLDEFTGFIGPVGIEALSGRENWYRKNEPSIFVIDSFKSRILKISEDGEIVERVDFSDFEERIFSFYDLAVDYYGYLWVVDGDNNCVHLFDDNLEHVVKYGRKGRGEKEFIKPGAISIWRRYGQVFIADSISIQYFWIGVDGWIEGVNPGIFKPGEGVTIQFYLTQPAYLTVNIYNTVGEIIRNIDFQKMQDPGKNYIFWDTKDEKGKKVDGGNYRIELILEPTYSSKGNFVKKLSTEVQCSP